MGRRGGKDVEACSFSGDGSFEYILDVYHVFLILSHMEITLCSFIVLSAKGTDLLVA